MGFRSGRFGLLLAFACCTEAHASDEPVRPLDLSDLGAPAFTVYTTHDGVPDEVIVAAEVDAQGFAWLGSASTVARFDGHAWEALPPAGTRSLVRELVRDGAGTLWAAFDSDGVARYDGRRWQRDTRAHGLPTDLIPRMTHMPDKDGHPSLWLETVDAGLVRRVADHWEPDPGNADLPPGPIWGLASTRKLLGGPRQWLGRFDGGIWFREPGGHWQPYSDPALDYAQVTDVVAAVNRGEEQLWVTTYGYGLFRIDAHGMRHWDEERGEIASNQLYTAKAGTLPNGDGVLWVASRSGLLRVHGDSMEVYDRRHGLPSNAVRGLQMRRSPDGADVLWIATERGIARTVVSSTPWRTVSLMGARANGVFSLLLEPDDHGGERFWVASS